MVVVVVVVVVVAVMIINVKLNRLGWGFISSY
jgi:hypothetical protein